MERGSKKSKEESILEQQASSSPAQLVLCKKKKKNTRLCVPPWSLPATVFTAHTSCPHYTSVWCQLTNWFWCNRSTAWVGPLACLVVWLAAWSAMGPSSLITTLCYLRNIISWRKTVTGTIRRRKESSRERGKEDMKTQRKGEKKRKSQKRM